MSRSSRRDRARNLFADALLARGREWRNAADSVRAGFENAWIAAGVDALVAVLLNSPDVDDEDDIEVPRRQSLRA